MRRLLATLAAVLLFAGQLLAQRTVSGMVTDDKGNPVPNASVQVKGLNSGTVTKPDGTYTLTLPANAKTLVFSSVDMESYEVSIGSQSVINATLAAADKSLQEVVVVGYGTQRKKETTGSVANVKGAAIANKPTQSFESQLAGRAAGVQITVPNGVLNTPPVFRIRGTNSISLSSYPLIVVDGVVSYTGDFSSTNAGGNALSSINPNDIESIDIAKDAAATAIYGSRAANGVVFITTKKGKSGKARINYDGWVGQSEAYRLPEMLNAFQYTDYKNEALNNARAANPASFPATYKFALMNGPDGQPVNTNWNDYIYRKGISHSHAISVSGANENTNYYFSAGYTDQEGILRGNGFKRMNALLNVDSRINKYFTIGGKLSFSNEKNLASTSSGSLAGEAYSTAGLGRLAVVTAPNIAPRNNDGTYNLGPQYIGPGANVLSPTAGNTQVGFFNPAYIIDKNRSNSENNHIQSNAYAQLKPLSWLTLRTVYGIDYILVDNDIFWDPIHGDGASAAGYANANYGRYKNSTWTNTAQFDKTFADNHTVSALVGTEQQYRTSRGFGINRQTLSDPAFTVVQAGYTTNNSTGQVFNENFLNSVFGRVSYDYKKKYFLTGNLRQDEYSALGKKKGTFWGASAGWEITKENFWTGAGFDKVFSSFKIRGSYGKVGNIAGIGDYASYSTFGSGLYGGAATLQYSSAGNNQITWETSNKTDIGFSFGVLNDRITGEFAYYKNDIDGLLLNVPQAPSTGLPSSITKNVGTMYNRGYEITLNAQIVQKKDFQWTSSINATFNKNEVTGLADGLTEILYLTGSGSTGENVNRTAVGYSIGYLWVVPTGGVDPATGRRIFYNAANQPILYQNIAPTGQFVWSNPNGTRYNNADGTSRTITQAADARMYRNTQPKVYGGFDNTFRYKNFDLNVLMTYQLGFWVSYGTNAGLHDQRFWNNEVGVLNRWTKPGDVTEYVKPIYGDNVSYGNTIPLDWNVFKGDFVKLRNLTLGFTLPKTALNKTGLAGLRLYVSAQNLAMITDYPGPDPEVASNGGANAGQGSDRNTIGNARVLTVGLNVNF